MVTVAAVDQKLLTFSLGGEGYGISILKVKEIIGMLSITQVPRTPEFIKGVINLRGKIIPIMDLRIKFGMDEKAYNERTCIIVIEVNIQGSERLLGVVVDTVSEVINISAEEIEPAPEYGSKAEHNLISGMGKVKDRVVIILDIEEVVFCDEMIRMLDNL